MGSLRAFIGVSIAGSFALCVAFSYWIGQDAGLRFAFFMPFTRAWEFIAGMAIVVLPVRWYSQASVRRAARVIGYGCIAVAAVAFSDDTVFPGVAALFPVVGTSLVLYGGTVPGAGDVVSRGSAWRPLVWMCNAATACVTDSGGVGSRKDSRDFSIGVRFGDQIHRWLSRVHGDLELGCDWARRMRSASGIDGAGGEPINTVRRLGDLELSNTGLLAIKQLPILSGLVRAAGILSSLGVLLCRSHV